MLHDPLEPPYTVFVIRQSKCSSVNLFFSLLFTMFIVEKVASHVYVRTKKDSTFCTQSLTVGYPVSGTMLQKWWTPNWSSGRRMSFVWSSTISLFSFARSEQRSVMTGDRDDTGTLNGFSMKLKKSLYFFTYFNLHLNSGHISSNICTNES